MPFTRMRYHIVFATKKRAGWIWPEVEDFLYPVLGRQAKNLGGQTIRIGGIEDHVHLICAVRCDVAIKGFVEDLKARSSKAVRGEFPNLYGFGWQRGFGCFTLDPLNMDEIVAYVENQKEHHGSGDLREVWERVTEHAPTFE